MRITSESFKTKFQSGQAPQEATVIRAGPSMVLPALGDRRLLWCISSSAVDRTGDIIDVNGWELDNFISGGSILWAHDPNTLPVGKPIKTYVENDKLWSVCEYPTPDISEFGDVVYKLASTGFLKGASIGMRPIDFEYDSNRVTPWSPFPITYKRQELLEWSHTPIPANPEALLAAKSMGLSLAPIKAWCAKVLDEKQDIPGVSREDIESTYWVTQTAKQCAISQGPDTLTKAEDESEPLNPAAEPETMIAERCNGLLDEFLAMLPMMETAADEGLLDNEKVKSCLMALEALLTIQETEIAEEMNSEEQTSPTGVTEEQIRALVREAIGSRFVK